MTKGERLKGALRRARERRAEARGKLVYLRKRLRMAKGDRARRKYRTAIRARRDEAMHANKAVLKYEAALRAYRKLIRRPYPHLSGDLDSDARVLRKLECVGKRINRNLFVTSGNRTPAEQKRLWDNRHNNPFPVAFCCPCQSNHCGGDAADVLVGGVPIQNAVSASTLIACGLDPLEGDAVHVEG